MTVRTTNGKVPCMYPSAEAPTQPQSALDALTLRVAELHADREALRLRLEAIEIAVGGGDVLTFARHDSLVRHITDLVDAAPRPLCLHGRALVPCRCDPALGRPVPGAVCPRHPAS